MRWLMFLLALGWMTGCVGLPARIPGPEDKTLTLASVQEIAGDYVIPSTAVPHGEPEGFDFLRLICHPTDGAAPPSSRLSLSVVGDEICLTLQDQERSVTMCYGFEIVDGEVQLARQMRWVWRYVVFWGPDFLKAGIIKRTDGSIVVRHMRGAIGVFIILPFGMGYPRDGLQVRFPPVPPGG